MNHSLKFSAAVLFVFALSVGIIVYKETIAKSLFISACIDKNRGITECSFLWQIGRKVK